jgi:hypothetical protein
MMAIAGPLSARLMQEWTYQDLFAKSDLVVIAKPTAATRDTTERSTLRDIQPPESVVGVVTEFQILLVLKGSTKDRFILHHYRLESSTLMVNGPQLIAFDPAKNHQPYLLFLVREPDGRFAPVAGQTDPRFFSVQELSGIVE